MPISACVLCAPHTLQGNTELTWEEALLTIVNVYAKVRRAQMHALSSLITNVQLHIVKAGCVRAKHRQTQAQQGHLGGYISSPEGTPHHVCMRLPVCMCA